MSSLDGQASELCARYQGKAQEFINNIENFPSNAAKQLGQAWESLKQEAQAAWTEFMLKANPVIKVVSEK